MIDLKNNSLENATETPTKLTHTELAIAQLLKLGLSNQAIALSQYISVETVRTHKKNIMQKFDVKGRDGLQQLIIQWVMQDALANQSPKLFHESKPKNVQNVQKSP
ncbi:MAG: response regulator transcription factor [Pseudarcicella sp.]|nr:response regulator transcription factor [Pseudarcicella sp.]MBP6410346.1 response regulator transcription factor [Pseudarcicella sp.]